MSLYEDTLLPTFEMSENDMYNRAISESLESKISKAVALLQTFEPFATSLNANGYYLCNSGGKDSGCIRHLAVLAGVAFTDNYNLTTLDPPELVHFIKQQYPRISIHRRPISLIARMVQKANPPTRRGRWCCSEYKEQGGRGSFKIIGVRAEESARRKGLWKTVVHNKNHGEITCPILYWTEDDVWGFHKKFNLPYCSLYDEGWKRLGCIGCPMSGVTGIKRDFKRWPKYETYWRKGFIRLWNKWHGVLNRKGEPRFFEKFGNAERFFQWWIDGVRYDEQEECQGMFMFSDVEEMDEIE
jgi:phosphoadenosine phosphosulfate reductase